MVSATATLTAGGRSAPWRRWRLSPPQLLAGPGLVATVAWQGTTLSPAHLMVMIACLLPWGLRTLLRLEQGLYVPAPTDLHGPLGRPDYRTAGASPRQAALALVEVDGTSDPVVRQANSAYATLSAESSLNDLFPPADAAVLAEALTDLHAGHRQTWDGRLELAGGGVVRAGLCRLEDAAGHGPLVVSVRLTRVPAPGDAPSEALEQD